MGNKVEFLPADEHKSFLQVDSITLDVHSQACSNYPKYHVCKIFTKIKQNVKDEVEFLSPDKHQRLPEIDTITLTCV